jgi:hypothetical protein
VFSISASTFHQRSPISRGAAQFCRQVRNTRVVRSYNRVPGISLFKTTPTNVELAWCRPILPLGARHNSFVNSIGIISTSTQWFYVYYFDLRHSHEQFFFYHQECREQICIHQDPYHTASNRLFRKRWRHTPPPVLVTPRLR